MIKITANHIRPKMSLFTTAYPLSSERYYQMMEWNQWLCQEWLSWRSVIRFLNSRHIPGASISMGQRTLHLPQLRQEYVNGEASVRSPVTYAVQMAPMPPKYLSP